MPPLRNHLEVQEDRVPSTEFITTGKRRKPARKAIFSGDPVEDMEIAKRLIGKHPNVDVHQLLSIATDKTQPQSARIAAIYTLGFTDDAGMSRMALTQIVSNTGETSDIKDHAAEALENITPRH
jgi:hypothetical protein